MTLNGVTFDGCRTSDGTMLEAKGSYAWAMSSPFSWYGWYNTSLDKIMNQADDQSRAAGLRMIEWHFAEPGPARYFRFSFAREGFDNIRVYWTPFVPKETP